MSKKVEGFSKFSKAEKIEWITHMHFDNSENAKKLINEYNHSNPEIQKLHDDFVENSLTNFYFPLGVAPNFVINGSTYSIPMAIEESSVIAAASRSAKFWASRGGFKADVLGTEKIGQVHFLFKGKAEKLNLFFKKNKKLIRIGTKYPSLTKTFLFERGVTNFSCVRSLGSTELMPTVNSATLISDIVSSGLTMKQNKLRPLNDGLILKSQACIFSSKKSKKKKGLKSLIRLLAK